MYLEYPGRIAVIEMHANYGDTLYNDEANQRWNFYPGSKYFPELYIDGHRHTGIWYWLWEDTIVSRMNKPSPVTITMTGSYNSYRGTGTVSAKYRNDSTASIRGLVMFVIIEDSIYHVDISGKSWHNHVAKDYLPGPNGQMITVPAGDSVTYSQPFTIPANWRYNYCSIVAFIQDTVVQPDLETKFVWQGSTLKLTQMIMVDEERSPNASPGALVTVSPNPCARFLRFAINAAVNGAYAIDIFDLTGRRIAGLEGPLAGDVTTVRWDCRDERSRPLKPGVYLWQAMICGQAEMGKFIVR